MEKNKGITLIALVVTIIVLLILAGISILMLTGENSSLSKARWAEFVNEYGNLDEVKNVFVLEQQTIENYEIKINKKFTLKSLFLNKSYAVDIEGIRTYYPVKGIRIDATKETNSLQRTIKYEENLNDEELSSEKVKLYEVDLSLLPSMSGVKRKYVINIVSGNLYSIDQVHYEGLIYHTPRYGIREGNVAEDNLTIYYKPGEDGIGETYTQIVPISESRAVTLDEVKFPKQGFMCWKQINPEDKLDDENQGEEFELKTDGYFGVVNKLKESLGDNWEQNILDIVETYSEEYEKIEKIEAYFMQCEDEIKDLLSELRISNGSIIKLAEWLVSKTDDVPNIDYVIELKTYEESSEQTETIPEEDEEYITYKNKETVNMAGTDMWLEAVWGNSIVTLEANGENAKVNGEDRYEIAVNQGKEYGNELSEAKVERTGYVFAGWWIDPTNESNENDEIVDTDIYDGNYNTLYAHWVEEENADLFTITYHANNGGKIQKSKNELVDTVQIQRLNGKKLNYMPTLIWQEMNFTRWYESDGTQVNKSTPITRNMDLYPNIQEVNLEFGENGGVTNRWSESKNPSKYQTKIEKYFNNWYAKKYGKIWVQNNVKMNNQTKQAGGYQLPYKYSKKSYYWYNDINYCRYPKKVRQITEQGGREIVSTFVGWYTQPNGGGTKVNWNSIWSNTNGSKLYAKWKEKYGVMYDANGGYWIEKGETKNKITIDKFENEKYSIPGVPKRDDGYIVEGWYDAKEGGTKVLEPRKKTTNVVTGDIILYAHWQKVMVEVCNVSRYGFDLYTIDQNSMYGEVKYEIYDCENNKKTITVNTAETMNDRDVYCTRFNISDLKEKTGKYTIKATVYNKSSQIVAEQEIISIVPEVNTNAKSIIAESLIVGIRDNDIPDGYCDMTVNGKTYYLDVLNITDNKIYDSTSDVDAYVLRGEYKLGTYNVSRTAVLKCDGNLDIKEKVTTATGIFEVTDEKSDGTTITSNCDGLTKVKGLVICSTGTLTNEGTIDMTARGTYDTEGENIYLWKNKDGDNPYEYVPAIGANGGASVEISSDPKGRLSGNNGDPGDDASNPDQPGNYRRTGGGGSGFVGASSVSKKRIYN